MTFQLEHACALVCKRSISCPGATVEPDRCRVSLDRAARWTAGRTSVDTHRGQGTHPFTGVKVPERILYWVPVLGRHIRSPSKYNYYN
ncbi:hypothetical protein RRG08_048048 [Elysia crispata]|uniref:Uncharacterized protein n=1 Tax=Elysia crispata TaxID=231223 RepID=A0AAE1D8R2_9GAST|nr:hypothetical protein RRG08_048048 [Elysia crispata]